MKLSPGKLSWLNSLVRGKASDDEVWPLVGGQRAEADGSAFGQTRRIDSKMHKAASRHDVKAHSTFWQQLILEVKRFFFGTKLNVLLIFVPLAAISLMAGWGDGPTCILSMIALIPLAERLGYVTEQLASYTNDSIGGLLNATFGNATELIISAFALKNHLLRVVQLSLLGSVVSNLLLVMGTAFLAGGFLHPAQTFNKQAISVHCGLLLLAVVAVLLPSMLVSTRSQASIGHSSTSQPGQDAFPIGSSSLILSRLESLMLLGCYVLFLVFQLCTHKHLYEGAEDEESGSAQPKKPGAGDVELQLTELPTATPLRLGAGEVKMEVAETAQDGSNSRSASGRPLTSISSRNGNSRPSASMNGRTASGRPLLLPEEQAKEEEGEAEEEAPELSWPGCFCWMVLVTVLIALLSEWIVNAIEGASRDLNVPLPFLVTILLPIVGNAAEHASAVMFAVRDRIELALGVAVGSSTQVSVLLVPFCVILAWAMGRPLDLNYSAFEASVFFISVLLSIVVLQDGTSNWLKGVMLLLTYVFVAAGFWCHQDETLDAEQAVKAALL